MHVIVHENHMMFNIFQALIALQRHSSPLLEMDLSVITLT